MRVAVLGASPKRDRYSNKAIQMLQQYGHDALPINPAQDTIEGLKCYKKLEHIQLPVHTVTVYIGPQNIIPLISTIIAQKPKRVIMNPGAESEELKKACQENEIEVVEGCTLVMLRTGQF